MRGSKHLITAYYPIYRPRKNERLSRPGWLVTYRNKVPPLGGELNWLLFVCLFVNLLLCTVAYFSAGDKASGVKFCTMVHGRPGHGISHFGELCSSRSPKSDESAPVLKMFFSKKGTVSKGQVSGHPGHLPWIRPWRAIAYISEREFTFAKNCLELLG